MIARLRAAALLAVTLALSAAPATAQPDTVGQWASIPDLPVVPRHMVVLATTEVMFFQDDDATLWDPVTGTRTRLNAASYNIFCSGHSFLPDGRVLVTGGHISDNVGKSEASIFDPSTRTWIAGPRMNDGRWYPTNTTLPNGDVLVLSGDIDTSVGVNRLPQVWETASGRWRNLTSAQLAIALYPYMHVTPDGRVFNSGPAAATRFLDPSGTGTWTPGPSRGSTYRGYGSAVMYQPGKILFTGGGDPPTAEAWVIDLTAATPAWRTVASMATARRQHNATVLPDGRVLVTGGTYGAGFNNAGTPVFAAELWDPATEQWATLASAPTPRLYHSTAALLPDGRVLSAGGDGYLQAEVFSPPYLFQGARPAITSAPTSLGYGRTFAVDTPDATSVSRVTAIALSSVTHGFNMSQRFLELSFTHRTGGLDVVAPASGNLAPPGPYLLFVLNDAGVPSIGHIALVGPTFTAPSEPPAFALSGTAATPNPVVRGTSTTIQTTATNSGGAVSSVLVDFEVYDAGGTKVHQQTAPDQSFAAGEARTFQWVWPVPATQATGTYTIKLGFFSADWSTLYTWVNDAGLVTVQAAAAPQMLTVTKMGGGTGTVRSAPAGVICGADCSEAYASGTVVTLTATVSSDSAFTGWSGACTGTGVCTVTMSAARSVTATFTRTFALTVARNGTATGTVTSTPAGVSCGTDCTERYLSGTAVALTPTPAAGAVFAGWSGACAGTAACSVSMTANQSVTATFTAQQAGTTYALTVIRNGTGGGTVTSTPAGVSCGADCAEAYPAGTVVTLSPTPGAGSVFSGWLGACTGTGPCTVTMSASRAATATFTAQTTGAPGFTADVVAAAPNPAPRGASTTVTATVTNTGGPGTGALVDFEIYNAAGAKIHQQVTTGQSFQSGERRTFQWVWPVPGTLAPGTYTIKLGFFTGNWATLYTWINAAGSISVP